MMKAFQHCELNSSQIYTNLQTWYSSGVGGFLLHDIKSHLDALLPRLFGYYALQIGILDSNTDLFSASRIRHQIRSAINPGTIDLLARADDLPFKQDSLDLILLLHTLDFAQDPHRVLREVDRTLIPEGHVLIVGFNSFSLYGLWKLFPGRSNRVPWCGTFYTSARLRDWLSLLGFDTLISRNLGHRPPINYAGLQNYLAFFEKFGNRFVPYLGGVHVILAKKKVATLTPIRPRWLPGRKLLAGNLAEPSTRGTSHGQSC